MSLHLYLWLSGVWWQQLQRWRLFSDSAQKRSDTKAGGQTLRYRQHNTVKLMWTQQEKDTERGKQIRKGILTKSKMQAFIFTLISPATLIYFTLYLETFYTFCHDLFKAHSVHRRANQSMNANDWKNQHE